MITRAEKIVFTVGLSLTFIGSALLNYYIGGN